MQRHQSVFVGGGGLGWSGGQSSRQTGQSVQSKLDSVFAGLGPFGRGAGVGSIVFKPLEEVFTPIERWILPERHRSGTSGTWSGNDGSLPDHSTAGTGSTPAKRHRAKVVCDLEQPGDACPESPPSPRNPPRRGGRGRRLGDGGFGHETRSGVSLFQDEQDVALGDEEDSGSVVPATPPGDRGRVDRLLQERWRRVFGLGQTIPETPETEDYRPGIPEGFSWRSGSSDGGSSPGLVVPECEPNPSGGGVWPSAVGPSSQTFCTVRFVVLGPDWYWEDAIREAADGALGSFPVCRILPLKRHGSQHVVGWIDCLDQDCDHGRHQTVDTVVWGLLSDCVGPAAPLSSEERHGGFLCVGRGGDDAGATLGIFCPVFDNGWRRSGAGGQEGQSRRAIRLPRLGSLVHSFTHVVIICNAVRGWCCRAPLGRDEDLRVLCDACGVAGRGDDMGEQEGPAHESA